MVILHHIAVTFAWWLAILNCKYTHWKKIACCVGGNVEYRAQFHVFFPQTEGNFALYYNISYTYHIFSSDTCGKDRQSQKHHKLAVRARSFPNGNDRQPHMLYTGAALARQDRATQYTCISLSSRLRTFTDHSTDQNNTCYVLRVKTQHTHYVKNCLSLETTYQETHG